MSPVSKKAASPAPSLPQEFSLPALQTLLKQGRTHGSVDAEQLRVALEEAQIAPKRMKVVLRALDEQGIQVTLDPATASRAVAATSTRTKTTASTKKAAAKKTTAKTASKPAAKSAPAPAKKAAATKTAAKPAAKTAATKSAAAKGESKTETKPAAKKAAKATTTKKAAAAAAGASAKTPAKKAAAKKTAAKSTGKVDAKGATDEDGPEDVEDEELEEVEPTEVVESELEEVDVEESEAEDDKAKKSDDEEEGESTGFVLRDDDEEDAPVQQVVTAGATADPVKDYLKQIGKVALLNAEQEVELAKRIEAGLFAEERLNSGDKIEMKLKRELWWIAQDGKKAKNHLIEANMRLVVSLAKRYMGRGMLFLDLIQEGNLGLISAVEKFDYTKGYKF